MLSNKNVVLYFNSTFVRYAHYNADRDPKHFKKFYIEYVRLTKNNHPGWLRKFTIKL